MRVFFKGFLVVLALLGLAGCSVMPAAVRKEALTDVPFDVLVRNASEYSGRTVILGGYVVDVQNEPDSSRITAVQAPLGYGDEPKSKDLSQGRLIIEHEGFLDPEVYKKDRRITVAGKILGSSATEKGSRFPYVRLWAGQIHLWSERRTPEPDPFWYYGPYYYPYPHPFLYPWGWYRPYPW